MTQWSEEYPHELHANVLLLDNKIECWKTGDTKAEDYWPFRARWKKGRFGFDSNDGIQVFNMGDYTVKSKTWIVNNSQEHNEVFTIHAPIWYRNWEHADDYELGRAYERE